MLVTMSFHSQTVTRKTVVLQMKYLCKSSFCIHLIITLKLVNFQKYDLFLYSENHNSEPLSVSYC